MAHTLFGPIALTLGLVNLLPAFRQRLRWPLHRWLGRIDLIASIVLGLAGSSLSLHVFGGPGPPTAFGLLALATIGTSLMGYRSIRARNVRRHRDWMLRSYALIFAAVGIACANATTREGRIPGARDDCEAASVQVANRTAAPETFKALAWCDETGPTALAATWRSLPTDTVRLRTFLFASSHIRDGRIFSAAHATAIDSTRRAKERAAALLVLVAQLDSTSVVTVVPASRKEVWRAQLARDSHASQIAGTKPLPADAHERVNGLVRRMAVGVPAGAAGLRDPIGVAVQAARLDLKRLPVAVGSR